MSKSFNTHGLLSLVIACLVLSACNGNNPILDSSSGSASPASPTQSAGEGNTPTATGAATSIGTEAETSTTPNTAENKLFFQPIVHEIVDLPKGVMPWAATWAPDGKSILFTDYNDNRGNEWIVPVNLDQTYGKPYCLTCTMADRPTLVGVFSYIFPDNQRMFIANELGDFAYVLECMPNLYNCAQHAYKPVDLSADEHPVMINLGRRTFHLSPDGNYLAYSMVRPDALVMMVSRLVKTAAGYAAVEHKVINPPPPSGPTDMSQPARAASGQLYEFKSFADGGRSAIVVGEPTYGNADMLKVDLATGTYTRLTGDADWDEDGAVSPNGKHLVVASWRGMNRLAALNLMPLSRPFAVYPMGALIAIYYVSSHQGFACDLQPWLLDAAGDKEGTLMGQPLAPYKGGNDIIGNNLAGVSFWSPDSTRVIVQERQLSAIPATSNDYVKQKGTSPNRLLIARVSKTPSGIAPSAPVSVGNWSKSPQEFLGGFALPGVYVINGDHSGNAVLTIVGNVAAGQSTVQYNNFSNDGKHFLNGTELTQTAVAARAGQLLTRLTASDATGAEIGFLNTDLAFIRVIPDPGVGEPPLQKQGSVDASYKGKTAQGLPDVGACPNSFPKPSALQVKVSQIDADRFQLTVNARINGDERPIKGATVTVQGVNYTSDSFGRITLSKALKGAQATAKAGDTFGPWQGVIQ